MDLGCGEGSLLGFLVGESFITNLVGVDLLKDRLLAATESLKPSLLDHKFLRERPLHIHLLQGDLCRVDSRCFGCDAITCVEVYVQYICSWKTSTSEFQVVE